MTIDKMSSELDWLRAGFEVLRLTEFSHTADLKFFLAALREHVISGDVMPGNFPFRVEVKSYDDKLLTLKARVYAILQAREMQHRAAGKTRPDPASAEFHRLQGQLEQSRHTRDLLIDKLCTKKQEPGRQKRSKKLEKEIDLLIIDSGMLPGTNE